MRCHFLKSALAIAAVAGMALLGGASPAGAVTVTYSTVGTFVGTSNTSVYTAPGVVITFEGVVSDSVTAPSQASFGQFNTTGTTATDLTGVSSRFTLDIFQTLPEPGNPIQFVGQLQGTLSATASTAFVQFDPPLSNTIVGISGLTLTTYTIVEADRNEAGVAIPGRANINPPSTQGGLSSVEGLITTQVIPEPSTLLMGALAAPMVLICLRKKGKGKVAV